MRKRFLVTAAALTAAVMLTACGGKKDTNDTERPTTNPTVTQAPQQSQGNQESAGQEEKSPEQMVQDIHQAVQEAYGDCYGAQMLVQDDPFFMGETLKLDTSWYDFAVVEVPMMSMSVDTFAIIHATQGNTEKVAKALKEYQTYLVEGTLQYPINLPKLQASMTGVVGDYVYFVILSGLAEDAEFMTGETEEEILEKQLVAYRGSNQLAVDTITGVINGDIKVQSLTELQKIHRAIKKVYGENYLPSFERQKDADYMKEVLKLDAAWYDDAIVEVPMISMHADMLILIDASEGNVENVKNALTAYKEYLVNEALQYPMNLPRVQSAVIEAVDDYVCFSILGGPLEDDSFITSEEELIDYYRMVSEDAIYALRNYTGIYE